jgi:hypothetical protein
MCFYQSIVISQFSLTRNYIKGRFKLTSFDMQYVSDITGKTHGNKLLQWILDCAESVISGDGMKKL